MENKSNEIELKRDKLIKRLDTLYEYLNDLDIESTEAKELLELIRNSFLDKNFLDSLKYHTIDNENALDYFERNFNQLCDLFEAFSLAIKRDLGIQDNKLNNCIDEKNDSFGKYEASKYLIKKEWNIKSLLLAMIAIIPIKYSFKTIGFYHERINEKKYNAIISQVSSSGNKSQANYYVWPDVDNKYAIIENSGFLSQNSYELDKPIDMEKIDDINFEELGVPNLENKNWSYYERTIDKNDFIKFGILEFLFIATFILLILDIYILVIIKESEKHENSPLETLFGECFGLLSMLYFMFDILNKKIQYNHEDKEYNKMKNTLSHRLNDLLNRYITIYNNMMNMNRIYYGDESSVSFNSDFEIEIKDIRNTILSYAQRLEKYAKKMDIDEEEYYHNIILRDDVLFENYLDHKRIRPMWMGLLKYIDFSHVDETNMEATNIDFTETNFIIDPDKVYKGDITGSYFNEKNLKSGKGLTLSNQTI